MTDKKMPSSHIARAFLHSCDGLKETYKSEIAFRQDVVICSILFIFALILPVGFVYKILMIFSLGFILIAELINTSLETTIDRISTEIHPLSKKAKDIGSAIVFLSFVQMIIVYLLSILSFFF